MQACITSNKTILLKFKGNTAIKQLNYAFKIFIDCKL